MNEPTSIERVVMRRVRLMRLLVLIVSTAMLAVLTGVVALWGIGREVWVAHVIENIPQTSGPAAFFQFWTAAFLHTSLLVQALSILTAVSLVFLIREAVRSVLERA